MSSDYENLKRRIDESIRKEEGRQRVLKAKREERQAVKKGGGGKAISKAILGQSRYTEDTDFNYGANVQSDNDSIDERIRKQQAERCMEKIYCSACKTYHGYCAEIQEEKEKLKMLPTGDNQNTNSRRTGGLNFINNVDLTTTPQEAKVLMVRLTEKGKNGQPSITIKLAFKGEIRYLWVPARKSDERYASLIAAFGPDENNWVDKRFGIYLKQNDFTENYETKIKMLEDETEPSRGRRR